MDSACPTGSRGRCIQRILVFGVFIFAIRYFFIQQSRQHAFKSYSYYSKLSGSPQLIAAPNASSRSATTASIYESSLKTYLSLRSNAREVFHVENTPLVLPATAVSSRHGGGHGAWRSLTIAQYSHVYGPSQLWMDTSGTWASCSQPCQAVGEFQDAASAASADVVVLSLQDFSGAPWERPPGQLWVGTYFESPDHYPNLKNRAVASQFNVTMGFRPDAEMPLFGMVYDTFKDYDRLRNFSLPDWEAKRAEDTAMMSVWISNCGIETTHRTTILEGLASHNVTYASYGRCKHTHAPADSLARLTDENWKQYGTEGLGPELVAAATRHLFFYAAENSDYPYYITEKVFHGLLAGSVPVYIGDATHLKMIAPARSIIYAEDYGSVEVLAAHLKAVAKDPTLYQSYVEWRADPQAVNQLERIMALPKWAEKHPEKYACALCEYLHAYFLPNELNYTHPEK
jgi:hypothetical protein